MQARVVKSVAGAADQLYKFLTSMLKSLQGCPPNLGADLTGWELTVGFLDQLKIPLNDLGAGDAHLLCTYGLPYSGSPSIYTACLVCRETYHATPHSQACCNHLSKQKI